MIAPRATRLVRVPDLGAFRRVVIGLSREGDVTAIRRRAILLPSQAAAEQLRRGLEDDARARDARALVLPHLLTRGAWVDLLAADLGDARPRLFAAEREALLGAASRAAVEAGAVPPFTLRPGLIARMLEFYDSVRRHLRTIDDFERVATAELERDADSDRGAARMLEQTRFLVAAFRGYEAQLRARGAADEHVSRRALIDAPSSPFTHVIVTVGDRAGDPFGLWPSDFDVLTRLAGLERLDVVATESELASGLLPRLRTWLPGIDEVSEAADAAAAPRLTAPDEPAGATFWRFRDREEELAAAVRRIKTAARAHPDRPLARTAVVYKRPLPYVYLARQLFPSAGVPFQAFDALPLAAEPFAALLHLVAECVETEGSRAALVALLRSPHLRIEEDGHPIDGAAVAALDRALADGRYLAGAADLGRLVDAWAGPPAGAGDGAGRPANTRLLRAGRAALAMAEPLVALREDAPPTRHLDGLLTFLAAYERRPDPAHPHGERHLRARGAVLHALTALRDAEARLDDAPRPFADTMAAVRRWIERQTFSPRCGSSGVQLVDARAARFGAFDTIHLVGLSDRDWPESAERNIFYPPSMLASLGWPAEADVRASERAAFEDLVHGAARDLIVSSITLDDDAIVEPSPFLEDLSQSGLPVTREAMAPPARMFLHDALLADPIEPGALEAAPAAWLGLRQMRSSADDARFHGRADPVRKARHKVSALDQYLACPFVYFAHQVLRLDEEPDDEESLGPKAQGRFVHAVLEAFFQAWQAGGHGAITVATLDEARALFGEIVEAQLPSLPEHDAALQRTRLLGSPVAPGLGDVVLLAEAVQDRGAPILERRTEFSLDGPTMLRAGDRTREVVLAAKADRLDLFADGTFRVIDYKLSKAPDLKHVVQLPAYAAAARQRLDGFRGRQWRAAEAAYIAFGRGGQYAPLAANAAQFDAALAEGEARLVDAVEKIERGEFPPKPAEKRRCRTCPFSPVCRKDIVDDD